MYVYLSDYRGWSHFVKSFRKKCETSLSRPYSCGTIKFSLTHIYQNKYSIFYLQSQEIYKKKKIYTRKLNRENNRSVLRCIFAAAEKASVFTGNARIYINRMIYLLLGCDIISVQSYAESIYHRTQCDIISKIYHPFRRERISLQESFLGFLQMIYRCRDMIYGYAV